MQAMISQSGRGGWRFFGATVTSLAYVDRRMLRRNSVALWQRIERPSAVARTSNSKPSQPWASASSNAAKEFSGASRRAPRCASSSGCLSIKIDVAQPPRIGSVFGALHRFLELFLQQLGLVFFRFDRLPEQRFPPRVLLFHGAGGLFKVVAGLGARRRGVRNHRFRGVIHFDIGRASCRERGSIADVAGA